MDEHQAEREGRDDRAPSESGEQVTQVIGDLSAPGGLGSSAVRSSGVDGADVVPRAELLQVAVLHATEDLLG